MRVRLTFIKIGRGDQRVLVWCGVSQRGSGKVVIGARRVMNGRVCSRKGKGWSEIAGFILVRFRTSQQEAVSFSLEWHRAGRFWAW